MVCSGIRAAWMSRAGASLARGRKRLEGDRDSCLVTLTPRARVASVGGDSSVLAQGCPAFGFVVQSPPLSGSCPARRPPPLQNLAKQRLASPLFQCYKSSKDHSPQLDVNLLGSTVVHKEKQVRKKEHKLKITPVGADVIVLGLQSKDQAEQWLRVREAPGCGGGGPAPLWGSPAFSKGWLWSGVKCL